MTGITKEQAQATDDRTRPLLLKQAATRGADDWRYEDAEAVIAHLLAERDAAEDRANRAEQDAIPLAHHNAMMAALNARIAELEQKLAVC